MAAPRLVAALHALDEAGVEGVVAQAVEDALVAVEREHVLALPPRRRAVESARLARTLRAWLAVERERAAFDVHALEAQSTVRLARWRSGRAPIALIVSQTERS
jgi:hypothetical protein